MSNEPEISSNSVVAAQLESYIDQMPPLSPSVSKILELANSLTASPKDLLDIIKIDPILTGKILKLINSAFYALPNQVTGLNKALILLGFNTIKNLALSTAILDNVHSKSETKGNLDALWDHCLGTAVAAKLLARELGVKRQELDEYFISGLLHDIGRIIILQCLPDQYQDTCAQQLESGDAMISCEQDIMGITHCGAGAIVAKKWKLPDGIQRVITEHHIESDDQLVNVIHVANQCCKIAGVGLNIDNIKQVRQSAIKSTGLTKDRIKNALAPLREEVEKAKVLLAN